MAVNAVAADGGDHNMAIAEVGMAEGMVNIALAIRDVYDKLNDMDRKLDMLVYGAARGFKV
jgi:hypothetical protein